jgi:hypothetical protein
MTSMDSHAINADRQAHVHDCSNTAARSIDLTITPCEVLMIQVSRFGFQSNNLRQLQYPGKALTFCRRLGHETLNFAAFQFTDVYFYHNVNFTHCECSTSTNNTLWILGTFYRISCLLNFNSFRYAEKLTRQRQCIKR